MALQKKTYDDAPTGNPLGDAPVPQLLLRFAPPAILSMMVTSLYNIIDTVFVGHGVGQVGIGATTVAFPLMMLMSAFAAWFGVGGNALAALRLGEGKKEETERVLGNTLVMLVVVPLALSIVANIFLGPVLDFLGATDDNRQMSHEFCTIILWGFVLQSVGVGLTNFVRTDGRPNFALGVMIVGTVVSCLLNWILVLVLHLGMAGSALATVAGQAATTALVIWYFVSGKSNIRLRAPMLRPDWPIVAKVCILGLSSFLVQVAGALTSSMLNLQITALGPTDPIGADGGLIVIGTVNKVISMLFFVIMGFSVASQPILGFNYGAQRYGRVRSAWGITIIAAMVVNLVLWILARVFCNTIMGFFGLEPELYEFAERTLMFMTLCFVVVPFQVVSANYFQATGQPLKATFLTLTRQLIFYLPCLFVVPALLAGPLGLTELAALPLAPAVADACAIIVTAIFSVRELGRLRHLDEVHRERLEQTDARWAAVNERVGARSAYHAGEAACGMDDAEGAGQAKDME